MDKIVFRKEQIEAALSLLEGISVKGVQNMKNIVGVQLILSQGTPEKSESEGEADGSNEHC